MLQGEQRAKGTFVYLAAKERQQSTQKAENLRVEM